MNTTSQSAREKALLRATNARRALASGGYYIPQISAEGTTQGIVGAEEHYRNVLNDVSTWPAIMARTIGERVSQGQLTSITGASLRNEGFLEEPRVQRDRRRAAAWRGAMTSSVVGGEVGNLYAGNPELVGSGASQVTDRWFQQTPYEREMRAQQDAPMMEPPELLEAPSKKRAFDEI